MNTDPAGGLSPASPEDFLQESCDPVPCRPAGLCIPPPGWLRGAVEEVGITLQSCSALLLLLCSPRAASGSNQWKLAHQNEGKAKATDRAIEMTSSRLSPGLGGGSSLV